VIRKLIGVNVANWSSTQFAVPCGKPPARSVAGRSQTRNYSVPRGLR
jgi:hypothetical protein